MSSHSHDYHLVDPSPWPLCGALAAVTMFAGLAMFLHEAPAGDVLFPIGLAGVLFVMYAWWKDVIHEGVKDKAHTSVVRMGLSIGMALFILSEVMFFFAFFWSFFKAAIDPVLLFDGDHIFDSAIPLEFGTWPPKGIETLDAWDIPLMNTLVLLLSGTTVTWAHYGLLHNDRKTLINGLIATVFLGACFTALQVYEYGHAMFGFTDGIYSSNFYMATGFHGAHVLIGTLFLLVCLIRALKGHFSADQGHLGFEFAAWYWHFVDVVWLFLFIFVYVWGA